MQEVKRPKKPLIKCEYYFSYRCWPAFLLAGLALLGASLFISNVILSAIVGVVGFSCLWSIVELFHQNKRVEKGWFPANPKFHSNRQNVDSKGE